MNDRLAGAAACWERHLDTTGGSAHCVLLPATTTLALVTAAHDALASSVLTLTPSEARTLASALSDLADNLEQDAAARAWSQELRHRLPT